MKRSASPGLKSLIGINGDYSPCLAFMKSAEGGERTGKNVQQGRGVWSRAFSDSGLQDQRKAGARPDWWRSSEQHTANPESIGRTLSSQTSFVIPVHGPGPEFVEGDRAQRLAGEPEGDGVGLAQMAMLLLDLLRGR